MNFLIAGDSWGWAWDDHEFYSSDSFKQKMLKNCYGFDINNGDTFHAVPIQKMCLEQMGHTVKDATSPGADNRGSLNRVNNFLDDGHHGWNPDFLIVNFSDPIRYDYLHTDLEELAKHVHSLAAFHAHLNACKIRDIQLYYEFSRDKLNSCPVLFIGGHNKISADFIHTVNQNNNTDILHCVLESSTDYFIKKFSHLSCDNVNENFSTVVDNTWSEDIIDYLLEWSDFTDEDPGYQTITWPDGGKHLNSSCQIKVMDILMCYMEKNFKYLFT